MKPFPDKSDRRSALANRAKLNNAESLMKDGSSILGSGIEVARGRKGEEGTKGIRIYSGGEPRFHGSLYTIEYITSCTGRLCVRVFR